MSLIEWNVDMNQPVSTACVNVMHMAEKQNATDGKSCSFLSATYVIGEIELSTVTSLWQSFVNLVGLSG